MACRWLCGLAVHSLPGPARSPRCPGSSHEILQRPDWEYDPVLGCNILGNLGDAIFLAPLRLAGYCR